MFMQRLIMTVILIPLVIAAIVYAPPYLFGGIAYLLLWGMSYEWQQFITLPDMDNRFFKGILIFLGAVLVAHFWSIFVVIDVFFWVVALFFIVCYPKNRRYWAYSGFISSVSWLLLGVFIALVCQWQQTTEGVERLFCVLLIVWAADIGAYLAGRRWGKHKILPQVSPGKSWEGLFGGLLLAIVVALVENFYMDMDSLAIWLCIVTLTALVSVVGDLWISVLKRQVSLKDTGHLIPGHGGLLDRLDSLLAAAPVFYCLMHWLG